MSAQSQLKGAAFEWFVRNYLISCGFKQVKTDNFLIYKGGPGLMVHGLGQPHNADVLLSPPIQIPFYYPARLLVECKGYNKEVQLPVIRNALGLREDINRFDIVTPDILRKRRNYRRRTNALYDCRRYLYQVGVASIKGFGKPAQEFAATHRIPLISFENHPSFQLLNNLMSYINDIVLNKLEVRALIKCFQDNQVLEFRINDEEKYSVFNEFVISSNKLFRNALIGILDTGDIIFIHNHNRDTFFNQRAQQTNINIHWSSESKYWMIKPQEIGEWKLTFELPEQLFNEWSETNYDRAEAINMKENNFSNIYLFAVKNGRFWFHILKLSQAFLDNARRGLVRK
ncbi:MAG: hypothetical protein ABII64_00960 [Elusimicrobiota bacterium]